jgi:hypothetical protein
MDSRRRRVLAALKQKYCTVWPDCLCNTRLLFYLDKFDREEDWSLDALAAVETVIFMSLRCIEDCCPDPKGRRWATIELMDPWWNRQRQGMELTDNG